MSMNTSKGMDIVGCTLNRNHAGTQDEAEPLLQSHFGHSCKPDNTDVENPLPNFPVSHPADTHDHQLSLLGISVYALRHVFLLDVVSAGFQWTSKIYEIENLNESPGVIRRKGEYVTCPVTGKLGASYVHCLEGADNIGNATHMLSYTWGYTIGDIISALEGFCSENHLDYKRTYVWICCLCVNQHRVVEMSSPSGILNQDAVNFELEFRSRVLAIGHILCLMSPWYSPGYLHRVWCIFELFTAMHNGCTISIVLPSVQSVKLCESVLGESFHPGCVGCHEEEQIDYKNSVDDLNRALEGTRVEKAAASVEIDRITILDMVKSGPGISVTNHCVNEYLRKGFSNIMEELAKSQIGALTGVHVWTVWTLVLSYAAFVLSALLIIAVYLKARFSSTHRNYSTLLALCYYPWLILMLLLGRFCRYWTKRARITNKLGRIFWRTGEYNKAVETFQETLAIQQQLLGGKTPWFANWFLSRIMSMFLCQCCCPKSILNMRPFLERLQFDSHLNIAGVLRDKGRYEDALAYCNRALRLHESMVWTSFGWHELLEAMVYNKIGDLLKEMGDYDLALEMFQKAFKIHKSSAGIGPGAVSSLRGMAETHCLQGDYDRAIKSSEDAIEMMSERVGAFHPDVELPSESLMSEYHPDAAQVFSVHAKILCEGYNDMEQSLAFHLKALEVRQLVLGENHPDAAKSHEEIGIVHICKGDRGNALVHLRKALDIRLVILGEDHMETLRTQTILNEVCRHGMQSMFVYGQWHQQDKYPAQSNKNKKDSMSKRCNKSERAVDNRI